MRRWVLSSSLTGRSVGLEGVVGKRRSGRYRLGRPGRTHVENTPMIRLFDRLGFVREGVLRKIWPLERLCGDMVLYAMTRSTMNGPPARGRVRLCDTTKSGTSPVARTRVRFGRWQTSRQWKRS
jgi:hypothetical protein